MADFAKLELQVDSKGAVTGKIALDNLTASAQKTQAGTKGVMDAFRTLQTVMQGPIAAFNMAKAAVSAVYQEMDALIMAGAEAQKSLTNFESVLAATGGVAGVTRKELNWLIEEMAGSTLFDDEDIRDAITALTRFRTVSGDTFKETIRLSADLAQVGGGSIAQYAQALGKAFKGEEEGLTMLKRAGIVFTKDQEEVAKAMYAVGDAAGAQKLILEELTNQLGGAATNAAETAAGSFQNMKKTIDDMRESFGMLVGQMAKESGLTGWMSGMAARMNDAAVLKEGQTRWKTGGLNATDVDILLGAAGRELEKLRQEAEKWGWTQYLPGTGAKGKLFAAQGGGGGYNDQIKALENFRGALLSLQLQYDALEKSAGKSNDTTSDTPGVGASLLGYNASNDFEAVGLEQIDIINAVIEREREEKALREASAESVAEYWANYISGAELAAVKEEQLAEAAKKARDAAFNKVIDDLNDSMAKLVSSGIGDAYLGIMESLGGAMASGVDASESIGEILVSLGETILSQLPRLLFYAGIQAMAYNVEVGLGLIAASGLVAIGAGVYSYYADQARDNTTTSEAATTAAATASASRASASRSGVTIINNSGVPLVATASESEDGAGGRMLSIEVTKAVRAAVSSGALDTTMRARFGMTALGTRKG